jgi:DNA-binding CsgD family transcriptional regulator
MASDDVRLTPRMAQTLFRLMQGDSEKQVARHLGISQHTVHVYVKTLYRRYGVCSRGELLSLFYNATMATALAIVPERPCGGRRPVARVS